MNKNLTFFAAIIVFTLTLSFKVQAQYNGPESVEYHSPSRTYFVSNTTSKVINRVWPGGNISVFVNTTGLNNASPYGLEIVGDTLYACTGGRIRAYRLADSTQLFNINLNGSFLNGITHDDNGNLYITDFSAQNIYRFNTQSRNFNIYASGIGSTPNGIIYDAYDGVNSRLVFANWGANAAIKAINIADSSISTLTNTTLTNIDGICKGRNGMFYLASWSPDRITAYDSTFTGPPVTISTNVANPADICYNFDGDTIAVPNAGNSTVTYIGLVLTGQIETAKSESSIFPNPAETEIKIQLKEEKQNSTINFISGNGKVIRSTIIAQSENVNISDLPAGFYIVEISQSGRIISRTKLLICR